MVKTPYQERVQHDGVASQATVYGSRIPQGKVAVIHTISAVVYTTNIGDYTTAKFIFVGYESNGEKCYVEGGDINATNTMKGMIVSNRQVVLKEGDRVFAEFETTATTTTYVLVASGYIMDKKDL